VSGCQALVMNNASISDSSASSGGALSISDTPSVLLCDSSMLHNTATGDSPAIFNTNGTKQGGADVSSVLFPGSLSAVDGMGGAILVQGATSALIYRSSVEHNTAGSLGGGLSVTTTCPLLASGEALAPSSAPFPLGSALIPSALVQPMTELAARSQAGCHSTVLWENSFRHNTVNVGET